MVLASGRTIKIDVALSDPRLLAHLLMSHGKRPKRLGNDLPRIGKHRQFAASRTDHLAVDEDDVAQVDVRLPPVQGVLPHLGQADHRLQLGAVAFLEGGEAELARVACEHHPSGNADRVSGLCVGWQVGVGSADLGEAVSARHLHRVRVVPLGEQPLALGLTDPELLRDVL